jgi:hypothetical protein
MTIVRKVHWQCDEGLYCWSRRSSVKNGVTERLVDNITKLGCMASRCSLKSPSMERAAVLIRHYRLLIGQGRLGERSEKTGGDAGRHDPTTPWRLGRDGCMLPPTC